MKRIIVFTISFFFTYTYTFAQKYDWQHLDLAKDSVFGMSTEEAYIKLLKNKKSVPVIVAIIDTGIDTMHEDLKGVLWINPKDGAHGRSYMGYEKGKEDITNLAANNKDFYDSLSYVVVPEVYRADYQVSRERMDEYRGHVSNLQSFIAELEATKRTLGHMVEKIGKPNPIISDFEQYQPTNEDENKLLKMIISSLPKYSDFSSFRFHEVDHLLDLGEYHLEHGLNMRQGEDTNDKSNLNDTTDVANSPIGLVSHPNLTPLHGTHVAGILSAVRNNEKGMNGVACNVQVMAVKVLTNIRELREEDLANGIRFATDNGAKIINLSFGKPYTWNKKAVDDAVRYAMSKDVLIVHAAGNEGNDLDVTKTIYPNPDYQDGGHASAWIEVGASGPRNDSTLVATFSNYGKSKVDVFAPGVDIYSTIPGSSYKVWSGTSMAAPMVSGVAALIRGYYPKLNALQVKDILIKSVVKINHRVRVLSANNKIVSLPFSEVCASGGIINAYTALKLAAEY